MNESDLPWDETTIGVGPACVADCAVGECPEDCPCLCDDCDGVPGRAIDTIDPAGGVL